MIRTWLRTWVGVAAAAALGLGVPAAARAGAGATAGVADKALRIEGFAQVRWQYDHLGARGAVPAADENTFRLRRLRLRLTGDWQRIFRVRLQLALQEFARRFPSASDTEGGGKVLEDAYVEIRRSAALTFLCGQFKVPASREELRSSSDQLVVDRSPVVNANFARSLWISRDLGFMLQGTLRDHDVPLAYYAGVWNGEGRNGVADFRDPNQAKLFGGRAEVELRPELELAAAYLANPILAGAGTYTFGDDSFAIPEDADYGALASLWNLDGSWTRPFASGRLVVEGEILQGTNTRAFARAMSAALAGGTPLPEPGDDGLTQRGMQAAANVLFLRAGALKGFEIGGRIADFDPDVDAGADSDLELAVALGFHWLDEPAENRDRLQIEFTNLFHERPGAADDWSVKVQWQVRY